MGDHTIIDDLIALRKERDITQVNLSRKSGIAQPVIARIEAKRAQPTLTTLQRLADALDAVITLRAK